MAEREYRIQAPDGSVLKIVGPVDATPDQLRGAAERAFSARQSSPAAPVTPPGQIPVDNRVQAPAAVSAEVPLGRRAMQALGDVGAGMIRGAGSIGATILAPVDIAKDALAGKGVSLESNRQRRQDMTDALRMLGADTDSMAFAGGRLASEVAGTMGAGGALAKAAAPLAKVAPQFVAALPSAGFAGGSLPARLAAGATVGGVSALAINPEEVATGATLGAGLAGVVPGASRLVGKGVSRLRNIGNLAQVRANSLARQAAGSQIDNIQSALAAADDSVTVGQATSGVNAPAWQTLADLSVVRDPEALMARNALLANQEQASVNALAGLAKGETAAATRQAAKDAKTALSQATAPLREEAFRVANASGLTPQVVTKKVSEFLADPGYASNDPVRTALRKIGSELTKWSDKNTGVIPAEALDSIRRNAVRSAIEQHHKGWSQTDQKRAVVKVLSEVGPKIQEAFEQAGGPAYANYLKTYAEGAQKIAQQKLAAEAFSLWQRGGDSRQAFTNLVNNQSDDVVERIMGNTFDIEKAMPPEAMKVLRDEAAKVMRNRASEKMVTEGRDALTTLLKQNKSRLKLPNWFSPTITTLNKGLEVLERNLDVETMRVLTEAMKSPKGAKDLLAAIPPTERSKILKILNNPETWGSTGQAVRSGVNALAVSDEPTE